MFHTRTVKKSFHKVRYETFPGFIISERFNKDIIWILVCFTRAFAYEQGKFIYFHTKYIGLDNQTKIPMISLLNLPDIMNPASPLFASKHTYIYIFIIGK